jgi:hypothetical protein
VLPVAIADEGMAAQYRVLMGGAHGAEIRKRIGKLDDDLGGLVRGTAFLILAAVVEDKIVGRGPATQEGLAVLAGVSNQTVSVYLPRLRAMKPYVFAVTGGEREIKLDRKFPDSEPWWGNAVIALNERVRDRDQELWMREMMYRHFRGKKPRRCANVADLVELTQAEAEAARDGLQGNEWWFAFNASMGERLKDERKAFEAAFLNQPEIRVGAMLFAAEANHYDISPAELRDLTGEGIQTVRDHRSAVWRHPAWTFPKPA